MLTICAGWDNREAHGYNVFCFSAIRRTSKPLRFVPLLERALRYNGFYSRKHERRDGQLFDVISDAPMSTDFAITRFLTPWLANGSDWALFADGADMLFLKDPADLFARSDKQYAVMVVKQRHEPNEQTKMDDRIQSSYPRKNWSSVVLWNLRHPANERLTLEMINSLPGRDLHAFCWLEDNEIGELPREWNYLVEVDGDRDASLAHFTLGLPTMPGHENGKWADLWRSEYAIMEAASGRLRTPIERVAS